MGFICFPTRHIPSGSAIPCGMRLLPLRLDVTTGDLELTNPRYKPLAGLPVLAEPNTELDAEFSNCK